MNHEISEQEKLQARILDALDGSLSEPELARLKHELKNHPELEKEFGELIAVDTAGLVQMAFPDEQPGEDGLNSVRKVVESGSEGDFSRIALSSFKKYVLAASLIFAVMAGVIRFGSQPPAPQADIYGWIYSADLDPENLEREFPFLTDTNPANQRNSE